MDDSSDLPSPSTQPFQTEIKLNGEQLKSKASGSPVEIHVAKRQNLTDPFMDLEVRINNPIGRLWMAIKRLWKSQKTTFSLHLTIPLLVLPLVLFIGYRLWMGRGVNTPLAKIGIIHQIRINGTTEHVFILPSSDVYLLRYSPDVYSSNSDNNMVYLDTTVVVFGLYSHITNELSVEKVALYDATASTIPVGYPTPPNPTGSSLINTFIQNYWGPFASFFRMFQ